MALDNVLEIVVYSLDNVLYIALYSLNNVLIDHLILTRQCSSHFGVQVFHDLL